MYRLHNDTQVEKREQYEESEAKIKKCSLIRIQNIRKEVSADL